MTCPSLRRSTLALGLAFVASSVAAQIPGVNREQMWYAPTAEDWAKPVLITFQRSWDDALAVSAETGKPILICVNMDGEIASEHYAGIRYRQPEKAALYDPYVNVIASVYRHSARDFDEEGNRILCPRFGSVTCGEHIIIEPFLYERYFDGQRIAPRHVMVELDKSETYDIFYAFDTDSVFQAISDGITERDPGKLKVVRGDRTIVERVASRDVVDRVAVEDAYKEGDEQLRGSLLDAAREHADAAPIDLLRLAVFGFDPEMSQAARAALAKVDAVGAEDLISEALRVPMEEAEREALIASLQRIGEKSPRARTLAVVHRGLGSTSKDVDVDGWSAALDGGATYAPPTDSVLLEAAADEKAKASRGNPGDATAQLELAEASLALAVDPKTAGNLGSDAGSIAKFSRLMFEDAHRAALRAEQLGSTGWRVDAAIALSAYYLGDLELAYAKAEAAAGGIPAGAEDWSAIATLAVFAQARQKAISDALAAKTDWPGEWLTDVNAAYAVLAKHPMGTDAHVAAHFAFLLNLGATGRAANVLDAGLQRFPDSWALHGALRRKVLGEKGVDGLAEVYAEMLRRDDASVNLEWFAGYAAIVAAEFHRRGGATAKAVASYDKAIAHYDASIVANPDSKTSADHYASVAIAGRARIAFEAEDYDRAVAGVLASFERGPMSANTLDGLTLSAVDTAKTLSAKLKELEKSEMATRVDEALGELDPKMLEPPAYETGGTPPGGQRRGGRRGGRRRGGR